MANYAKAHPEADLGLHLTLTSEWQTYRWGPIASRAVVPSLVGPDGYFYPNSAEVVKHAKLDEVEIEIRAQIERAKSMGLQPSHLDAHMHALYASAELFNVFLKVAHEYKLPIRMARNDPFFQARIAQMPPGEPYPDAILTPLEDVPASGWCGDRILEVLQLVGQRGRATEQHCHHRRRHDRTANHLSILPI